MDAINTAQMAFTEPKGPLETEPRRGCFVAAADSMTRQGATLSGMLQDGYRYALTLTQNATDADDLLQEACLRVALARRQFERRYLLIAIRTSFIDAYRRRGRRISTVCGVEESEPVCNGDIRFDEDDRAILKRSLARLRLEEREALYLMVGLDLSAAEAGRLCGKSRGTMLSLSARAKNHLREHMALTGQNEVRHDR